MCRLPLKGFTRRLAQLGRQRGIWDDRLTSSQNTTCSAIYHYYGAITIILRQSWLGLLFKTFAISSQTDRSGVCATFPDLVEDPLMERPFCLDHLIWPRQLGCDHI